MTEREKMLSGEIYDPTDKELEQLRLSLNSWSRASKPLFSRVLRLFPFRIAF